MKQSTVHLYRSGGRKGTRGDSWNEIKDEQVRILCSQRWIPFHAFFSDSRLDRATSVAHRVTCKGCLEKVLEVYRVQLAQMEDNYAKCFLESDVKNGPLPMNADGQ